MKQYTLLTSSGINKLLKTASDGSKIALKEIVVSDYDGELSEQTTSIPNEKYRGAINAVTIDENDNNILDVDAIIPPEVGGFYIKTAGIYCNDGSLFAVARLADTYKPLLNEGSSKDITLNFKLQISNANESIILKVDNNVVLATRKWSENQFLKKTDKIDAYTKKESDDKFALKTELTDGLPIGAYLSYSSQKTIPAGFLIADGKSLKKAEYTELFDVIGYTYGGSGDNFNLPNFADGKFMRGIGGNAAALGTAQGDAIRNIQGEFRIGDGTGIYTTSSSASEAFTKGNTRYSVLPLIGGSESYSMLFSASKVVPTANENRPYNMAVVVIIKAKNVNTPTAGQIDQTILATETKAGIAKLKNAITAKQEDAAVTEKAVSDFVDQHIPPSLGINQRWQEVTSQRRFGETYTNTTGKPIYVQVNVNNAANVMFTFKINNLEIEHNEDYRCVMNYIIPPDATYKVYSQNGATNYVYTKWYELR
ncbi:phage tail protein [Campylobacter concisus]|uniref:phage tail-collar fiber domain-containing protein n=1 Tax=Campylobacter concisus TaxID=199 RepID=UPI000CD822EE|nr:phage tail protein [Campylobacter concisus]